MSKSEILDNIPPPGYPTENSTPAKKKGFFRGPTKNKGGQEVLGVCLKFLCCCIQCSNYC